MSELVDEVANEINTPAAPDLPVHIVGVRLPSRLANRLSSYRVAGKWLRFGDACVVEHGDDLAVGTVWLPPRLPSTARGIPKRRVIRKASAEDLAQEQHRELLEQAAFRYAAEAILAHA